MKRYRRANFILTASMIFLFISMLIRSLFDSAGDGWIYFLAQSCFIGAFADWFAIESLFRNRLSIPYFTPLVERNKNRIIDTLQGMVRENILPQDQIGNWFGKISILSLFERWCISSAYKRSEIEKKTAHILGRETVYWVEKYEEDLLHYVRNVGKTLLKRGGKEVENFLLCGRRDEEMFHWVVEEAKKKVISRSTHQKLADCLEEWGDDKKRGVIGSLFYYIAKSDWLNIINYDDMATTIQDVLWKMLDRWSEETDPFHQEVLDSWRELMKDVLKNKVVKKEIENFIFSVYERCPVEEKGRVVLCDVCHWLQSDEGMVFLERTVHEWVEKIRTDESLRQKVDVAGSQFIQSLVQAGQQEIYAEISCRLDTLTVSELNEFIESRVHRELEGIRINGAVIGALAGGLLYVFIEYLYVPAVFYLIR